MLELSAQQIGLLERLAAQGFEIVAYPLYASRVGVRKGNCAALLDPVPAGGLKLFGDPCYVVAGQLGVPVFRGGRKYFVWKKKQIEATAEREGELARFRSELAAQLATE